MNKLIPIVALTSVVFLPLTLISLTPSASAHHTSSHVSTIAIETNKTIKVKIKKDKKSVRNVTRKTTNSI